MSDSGDDAEVVEVELTYRKEVPDAETPAEARGEAADEAAELRDQVEDRVSGSSVGTSSVSDPLDKIEQSDLQQMRKEQLHELSLVAMEKGNKTLVNQIYAELGWHQPSVFGESPVETAMDEDDVDADKLVDELESGEVPDDQSIGFGMDVDVTHEVPNDMLDKIGFEDAEVTERRGDTTVFESTEDFEGSMTLSLDDMGEDEALTFLRLLFGGGQDDE